MPDPLRGFHTEAPDPTQMPLLVPEPVDLGPARNRGFHGGDLGDPADPLRITLGQAAATPPDTAAEVFQLRAKTGLPAGVIERNLADVRRQAASADFNAERFRRDNPQLTRWLLAEPPERAALVQDDLEPLGALETTLTKGANVARSLGAATWRLTAEVPWAGLELTGDVLEWLTGSQQLSGYARWVRRGAGQTAAGIAPDTTGMGATERAIYAGVESVAMNVPLIAAQAYTGVPLALPAMGVTAGLESYGQARDVGATVPRALMYGATQGGIEVLTEKIPLGWFFKDLATRTGFVKMVAKQVAAEIPGEQVATFFQDLSEWTNLHPEAPASEFLAARPGRAYETLVSTVVAAGLQTAAIRAADRVVRLPTVQRVIEDLHAATAATKTHARAPTELADFIRQASTGLPTVYAAVEPFIQYFQEKGADPAQVAAQLTGDPSAYALALETGDLPIPTENYLTQVVGSGDEAFYALNLRLDANLSTANELITRTEGEVAARAAEAEAEVSAQTEADVAGETEAEGQAPPPTPQEAVHAQMVAELTQGGRVDATTAEIVARVVSEAFPTMAARAGVDLATLAQRWLPIVQRGTTAAGRPTAAGPGPGGAPVVPGAASPQAGETLEQGPPPGVRTNLEITGSSHGQQDGMVVARAPDGTVIGRLDFARVGDEVSIQMVEVAPAVRRQGIGRQLLQEVRAAWPTATIQTFGDVTTDEGRAFIAGTQDLRAPGVATEFEQGPGVQEPAEPVATLTGDELGVGITDRDALRDAAMVYYTRELQHGLRQVDRPGFGVVMFSGTGKREVKTYSANPDKLRLLPAVPAIIERGVYDGSATPERVKRKHPRIRAYHYFSAPVQLRDRIVTVGVTVIEDNDGNKFYNVNPDPEALRAKKKARNVTPAQMGAAEPSSQDQVSRRKQATGPEPGEDEDITLEQRIAPDEGDVNLAILEQGPRARVTFGAGRPLVELFRASNRSSFLHETWHVFLRMMGELSDSLASQAAAGATLTPEQQQLLSDYRDVVLPHLGVTETAQIGTAQQEQWAREGEAFLMEGTAPSPALRRVFGTIARWMTRIYKSLQGLSRDAGFEVQLTPDIRAVMNRLLASDAAIEQAEREGGVQPLITTPAQAGEMGLSPEAFAGYRQLVEAAANERRAQLAQRMMQDLAREDRAWWKAERARVRDEVEAEVQARPEHRAWFAVKQGTAPNGTPLPTSGDPDAVQVAVPLTLSTPDLKQHFSPAIVASLRGLHNEGGLPADMVAPMVGYGSGAELVQALATVQPMETVIEETTDLRMREAHGDLLLHPDELAEEARRAVTDHERDAVIRAEMAMLRKLHAATAPVRAAERAQRRTTVRRLREDIPDRATLDQIAQAQIRNLKLPQIRPDRFFAAAARASRRATEQAAKGNTEEALRAKQDELINLALFRAAQALQDDVEQARVDFAKMFTNDKELAKRRNMDYVAAARALAAHYFWPDRRLTQAREALARIEDNNRDLYQELGARVDRVLASGPTLQELTGGGWLDLHEAVSSLWTLSLRDQQSLINGAREDREAIVAQLTAHLDTLGPPEPPRSEGVTQLLGVRAALTRVEHWISYVDQQNPNGVFRRYVFQPVADAIGAYRLAKKDILEQFLAILTPIKHTLVPGQIVAPELGYTFASKAALLHAIAHSGNPSNLERLLRGRGWMTSVDPTAPLDTSVWRAFMARIFREGVVTKADMDFVQALWNLNESLKPAAQAAHHEMFGYYFHELTASPVDTPFGTYPGGYVPAILDPFESADGTARIHMDAIEGVSQTMFPPAGFVQRRAEHYAQPLALDLALLPQHLDKVLRFIHLLPRAKEVNRLVADRRFGDRLHAYDPTVRKDLLQPWLQRAYSQQVTVASTSSGGRVLDRFAKALRSNAGLTFMGGHFINALQNILGWGPALLKVKPRYLRHALWRFMHQPRAMSDEIERLSAFMAETGSGQVAEMFRELDELLLNPSRFERVQEFSQQHGYLLQTFSQNLVSRVVWMGAYEQASEANASPRDAVRQADSAVRETQGSSKPEDISAIEQQSAFARLFLMFFGWANMMANLNGYQLAATARDMGLRKGAGRALYIYTFGFMLPAVLSEAIRQAFTGFDDDDDETHLDEILYLFFASQGRMLAQFLPGVGPVGVSVVNFFNDVPYDDRISVSPAITLLESALRSPASVYKAILDDGPKKRAVRDALSAIGLFLGLPAGWVMRPAGYLADMADENVEPETTTELVRGLVSGRSQPP